MKSIMSSFKLISPFEKILVGLLISSIVLKYLFNYRSTVDVIVFGGLLSILYFPLGFYFLGKPGVKGGILISITLGFVYSIGIITSIYGFLNLDGYFIIISLTAFLMLCIAAFLILKLKANKLSKDYLYSQFGRMLLIVITNLIVLLKHI